MRMLMVVVVVGMAVVGTGRLVRAAEDSAGDGLFCLDRCDQSYDACMRRRTGKGTEDCPGTLLRCRNGCDPNWRSVARKEAEPRSCRDRCQARYDDCIRADDGKHGAACAKDVMVCRDACPPDVAGTETRTDGAAQAGAPPAAAAPQPRVAAAAPVTPPAPVAPAQKSEATTAAIAPAEKTARTADKGAASERSPAASAIDKRAADPKSVPPKRAVANSPHAGAAAAGAATAESAHVAAAAAPASQERAERAVPAERSRPRLWTRIWCGITGCGGAKAKAPLSCNEQCTQDYETCIAHEDPKRGGECAAQSLRCKQACNTARSTGR